MILKDQNTRDHLAWTAGNGDPMNEVFPTQDTQRRGTARVKQQEEAGTRIIVIEWYEIWKKGRGPEGERSQTRPN